jgi:hypothetical protein
MSFDSRWAGIPFDCRACGGPIVEDVPPLGQPKLPRGDALHGRAAALGIMARAKPQDGPELWGNCP